MVEETVSDVTKKETARQTVILVFSLAGTVAMVWVMQKVSNPDSFRTAKMYGALTVKRFAESRSQWWADKAAWAATIYNSERL
jgi:hypothetical protein